MTKKFILSLLFAVAAIGLTASPQHSESGNKSGQGGIAWGKDSHIKLSWGGQTDLSLRFQKAGELSITVNTPFGAADKVSSGVVVLDKKGNVIGEYDLGAIASGKTNAIKDKDGNVVNFDKHTQVGVWVSVDGKKYYSTGSLNENGKPGASYDLSSGDIKFTFDTGTLGGDNPLSEITITINSYDKGKAPSGQPLPGYLFSAAAILTAIACLLLRRFRRARTMVGA